MQGQEGLTCIRPRTRLQTGIDRHNQMKVPCSGHGPVKAQESHRGRVRAVHVQSNAIDCARAYEVLFLTPRSRSEPR